MYIIMYIPMYNCNVQFLYIIMYNYCTIIMYIVMYIDNVH